MIPPRRALCSLARRTERASQATRQESQACRAPDLLAFLRRGQARSPAKPVRQRPLAWLLSAVLGAALLPACGRAQAGDAGVVLSGRMGDKALLVINGSPRALAVGATEQGVKLLGVAGDTALVEVNGQRLRLQLGATQVSLGGAPSPVGGSRVVLSMGTGGHFTSAGSINGRPVQFMVDTGASLVALSQGEAERIGLRYQDAPKGLVQTANGQVPVHSVRLATVRVGEVQVYDVEAVVMPASLGVVLLGNSFLSRFQLRRDNTTMTLDKRP